jgi:hypothetical protein
MKRPDKSPLFDMLKDDFEQSYKFYKKVKYVWEPTKDNRAVGQLINKFNEFAECTLPSDMLRKKFREFAVFAFTRGSHFIRNNMTFANLSAQFNIIMPQLEANPVPDYIIYKDKKNELLKKMKEKRESEPSYIPDVNNEDGNIKLQNNQSVRIDEVLSNIRILKK